MLKMISRLIARLYFRDVEVIGLENVPREGPAIIACNHNSQFVDAMMLILSVSRPVNFVIAASSTKNPFLKHFLKFAKMIPTVRPIDHRKPASGTVAGVRGDVVAGSGTQFTKEFKVGDFMRICGLVFEFPVVEVLSDSEVRVRVPEELKGAEAGGEPSWREKAAGQKIDVMPKVNQENVHERAVEALARGELVVIFPEGGSHDQTKLIPLKAGACLFMYSARKRGLDCPLVCVGVNYYGSHKFRSRVVVNIGSPRDLPLDPEKGGDPRYKYEYISESLETLRNDMQAVKINIDSYSKLLVIATAKEVFLDKDTKLDAKFDFLLLKKFNSGFNTLSRHPDVAELERGIEVFRKRVKASGLRVADLRHYQKFLKANAFGLFLRLLLKAVAVL